MEDIGGITYRRSRILPPPLRTVDGVHGLDDPGRRSGPGRCCFPLAVLAAAATAAAAAAAAAAATTTMRHCCYRCALDAVAEGRTF